MPKDNPSVGRRFFRILLETLSALKIEISKKWGISFVSILLLSSTATGVFAVYNDTAQAQSNNTINFRARILQASGALVPDGDYHLEFKIYNDPTAGGQAQGTCSGNCLWMETRSTGNLVRVVNGYISVYLGDVTAFPTNMPWSNNLYVTMRVGGTSGPSWDTEMVNATTGRMKLSSVPFAYQAANVASANTNSASTNSSNISVQTGNASGTTSNSGNITIDTGTATGTAGTISLGSANASALTIGRAGVTTTIQGSVSLTGAGTALTVTNNVQVDGNTILGSDSADTLTVNANANFTGNLTVTAGDLFTNAGATLFTAITIANDTDGGVLGGNAASTVDVATTLNVAQTTTLQTFTLASPTTTTSGRIIYVNNTGSADFTLEGNPIAAGSSASYIWNGSDWVQTISFTSTGVETIGALDGGTANANGASISGTTIYLQSASDTYAGLVNTTAQNFAGVKTFTDGLVVAAGESLTVTGGNTASRPASPTEGMIYFDTDTDSLLVYANGKWQSDRGEYVVVASSHSTDPSTQAERDSADYVTDGTSDETEINQALSAASGGKVILLGGTYVVDGTILIPNNTMLTGVGSGTVIELDDLDTADNLIENSDTTTGTGIVVRDLKLDGRSDLNSAGAQHAMFFKNLGSSSSNRKGLVLQNTEITRFRNIGLYLTDSYRATIDNNDFVGNTSGTWFENSAENKITNNRFAGNLFYDNYVENTSNSIFSGNTSTSSAADYFIYMQSAPDVNVVSANVTDGVGYGFYSDSSVNQTVVGNTFKDAYAGVYLNYTDYTTVSGNSIFESGGLTDTEGIVIFDGDYNSITSNTIFDSSCTTTCYSIRIQWSGSDNNYLADNVIGSGTIDDDGTNTIYAGQTTASTSDFLFRSSNSANAFSVQTAGGADVFNVNTSTVGITVTGTATVTSDLTVDTNTLYVNATDNFVSVGSTSDLGARFQVVGANDETQLLVRANGTQSMANPLVLLQNSSGAELARINATTSSLFFGNAAGGSSAAGANNTGIGASALGSVSTGTGNTTLGSGALASVSVNSNNTAVGYNAGNLATGGNNIFLGALAGDNVTTGTDNIIIGYNLDASSAGVSNELRIGGVLQGNTSTLSAQFNGTLNVMDSITNPYGGLGISQNLLQGSERMEDTFFLPWVHAQLTSVTDGATAPNSTATAETVVTNNAGANTHIISQTYTTAVNGNYNFSIWVRATSGTEAVRLRIDSTGATPTTGTASDFTATTAWRRIDVTQNFTGTPSDITANFIITDDSSTVEVWGAQLRRGTSPNVYTQTRGAISATPTPGLTVQGDVQLSEGGTIRIGTGQDCNNMACYGAGQITNFGDISIQASSSQIYLLGTTVSVGNAGIAGNLAISDGSSNTATINVGALAGNYTVSIPTITANDTFCLQSNNCGTLSSSLNDNVTDALDIQEGTNNYFNINTTNGSENISFGNATTNPSYSFLGSGTLTVAGPTNLQGTLTFFGATTDITTGTNEDLLIQPNGNGTAIIRSSNNQQFAFRVQNSASGNLFTVDTLNSGVYVADWLGFIADPDTGFYRPSADAIDIYTNNVARLSINNTGAATFSSTLAVTTLGSADTSTFLCRNSSNQLATCNFTPLSSSLTDNITDAFDLQEGTNNYININTTNGTENISFGNATTNPDFNFLGSGTLAVAGSQTIGGNLTVDTNTLFVDAGNDKVGIGTTTTTGTGKLIVSGSANDALYGATAVINGTTTSTTNSQAGLTVNTTISPSGSANLAHTAILAIATTSSNDLDAGSSSAISGFNGASIYNGTGTLRSAFGGTVSVANTGSGTITAARALYIPNAINSGGGTIFNQSGITMQQQSGGTNNVNLLIRTGITSPSGNWNIYAESAYDNALAGNLRVGGTAAPTVALDVTGAGAFSGALTVTGLTTLNGGLTIEAGDTFTFNGDAFTDFTGGGLVNTGGVLSVDTTSATGFFRNGGNAFTANSTIGNTGNFNLNVMTNNLTRLTVEADGDVAFDTNTLFVDAANDKVGIGTATPTNAGRFEVVGAPGGTYSAVAIINGTTTSTSFGSAFQGLLNVAPGSASTSTYTGVAGTVSTTSANTSGATLRGLYGLAEKFTGGTLGTGIAAQLEVRSSNAGAITTGIGLDVMSGNASGGGTITSLAGVRINAQTAGTNNTNLLIGTATIPSGNWSIYNSSTSNNYLAGNLGIGQPTAATIDGSTLVVNNQATTDNLLLLQDNGTARFTVADGGFVTQNATTTATTATTGSSSLLLVSSVGSASTARYTGNLSQVTTLSTNLNGATAVGLAGSGLNQGGTLGQLIGAEAYSLTAAGGAGGVTTKAIGLQAYVEANGASGSSVITTGYGILIGSGLETSGGTIGDLVGLAIDAQTSGTNNTNLLIGTQATPAGQFSIYNSSTNNNVFGGNLTLAGTVAPTASLSFGEGATRSINVITRSTNAAGNSLTVSAGAAGAGGSAFSGGVLTLQGGAAAGTGNANGGNVVLTGGVGVGTGVRGLVVVDTATFDAATVQNFTSNTTITQANIDRYGSILISGDVAGRIATLTDPTNTTTGRIIYVTNSGSVDITLAANSVGVPLSLSLKPATTATMYWNGVDWTAAGASSSTDLQAAYNNTATSAGGAELILNAPGGNADGLTIRNNATTPIVGGILEVQTSIGTNLFSVNNLGTELANNGGAETAGGTPTTFPANSWTAAPAGGTVARTVTGGQYITGQAGASVVTTATTLTGIRNNLTGNPVNTIGAEYQVSFAARSSVNGTQVQVDYSRNGGTNMTTCSTYGTGVSYATLSDTEWTKVTCTITIDSATAASDPDLFIRKIGGGTPTIYIDNLSFIRNDTTTQPSNVQIGGGITGGQVTLFTLDRSSAPPVANGDETFLGSMYYDTTSGRIQCYEADGWGACGSAPNNYVNLTPEYPGSVLNGTGVGTMTADFCANQSSISFQVNTTFCANGESKNYYAWTSPQATEQTYSIYITYQLPAAFRSFDSDNTVALTGRTSNTTTGSVTYEMFRNEGGAISRCGTETTVTTSNDTWQTVPINGNESTGCGFSSASADDFVIFKINMKARSNATVYASTLSFTTTGQ